jgi:hypothetical protein
LSALRARRRILDRSGTLLSVRLKLLAAAFCWFLLAVGCTSQGQRDTDGPPPTQPGAAGVFQITGGCEGLPRLRGSQVSFVLGSDLYVARRSASVARCVLEVPQPLDVDWGPQGDRVSFGDLRRYEGDGVVALDDVAESIAWSRPTGRAIVYVSEGRLMKVDAFGEEPVDISFLADHDEVVYHPAGTHVAVTGTAEDGTYGLWLATNVGKDAQLLAIGEDALRIFSLSFAHDGTTMYYAAEHEDRYDVHSLRLALQDEEGAIRDAELGTLDSASTEMGDVVVSEFVSENVAYTVGSCEEGKTTRVWDGSVTELGGELEGLSTEPVGWLPNGELLVLARRSGCEGEGTLYAWSSGEATRLVPGVSVAGVRAALPPPPDPPASEQQAVA